MKHLRLSIMIFGCAAVGWAQDLPAPPADPAEGLGAPTGAPVGSSGVPLAAPPAQPMDDVLSLLPGDGQGSASALSIRDPFKAPEVRVSDEAPKGPLELIAVDRFKLLGVITGPDRFRAMLQDPEGHTHLVSEKMKIGNRKGVVKKITSKGLWIQEKVVNVLGQEESVDTVLKLDALGKPVQADAAGAVQ